VANISEEIPQDAVYFDSLDLEEAPINIAVDELLEHIATMTDRNGKPLFVDAGRGWAYPEGTPTSDMVPALRIWHQQSEALNDNQCFHLSEEDVTLSIFIYVYSFGDQDIQAHRERFVRAFLKKLRWPQSSDPIGVYFQPQTFRFVTPQAVTIDHTNAFKRISDMIAVRPHPWYVTRVDIAINVYN